MFKLLKGALFTVEMVLVLSMLSFFPIPVARSMPSLL